MTNDWVMIEGNPAPVGARLIAFEGAGRVGLRALIAPPAKDVPARGSVILSPGRTEFIEKYFEVIGELQARGFHVACIDHRGQGLSERALENPQKGHVTTFADFALDLETLVTTYADDLPTPRVLLCHSMGGTIGLTILARGKLAFEAAAFSAPMWGIKGVGMGLRRVISTLARLGFSAQFAPGVEKDGEPLSFENNVFTHDADRYQRYLDLLAAEPLFKLAGPTFGWAGAAHAAFVQFEKTGALEAIKTPILVASAGQEDLISNQAIGAFAERLPHCDHVHIAGAFHEILMETNALRDQFWAAFDTLTDVYAPKRP